MSPADLIVKKSCLTAVCSSYWSILSYLRVDLFDYPVVFRQVNLLNSAIELVVSPRLVSFANVMDIH